jgi:hypothetical protein
MLNDIVPLDAAGGGGGTPSTIGTTAPQPSPGFDAFLLGKDREHLDEWSSASNKHTVYLPK